MKFKNNLRSGIALILSSVASIGFAASGDHCYDVGATITNVDDAGSKISTNVEVGETVYFSFNLDGDRPLAIYVEPEDLVNFHYFGPRQFSFYHDDLQVQSPDTDRLLGGYHEIGNNLPPESEDGLLIGDYYYLNEVVYLQSENFQGLIGDVPAGFTTQFLLRLSDPTAAALTHTELRANLPLRDEWDYDQAFSSVSLLFVDRRWGTVSIEADITSISSCSDSDIVILESIIAQLDSELDTLEALLVDQTDLIEQVEATNSALNMLIGALQEALNDDTFTVAGTADEIIQTLTEAIKDLNHGQQQALYVNLGGSLGLKKSKKR